jgi:hypothetical protein
MNTDPQTQTEAPTAAQPAESYEPTHLKLWTHPQCYVGEVWPGYYGAGFGQSRDSGCLERSNFKTVREALDKLPEWPDGDSRITVRETHWAVGWVEWIAIHQDDTAALKLCDEFKASYENYPVLDEQDYTQTEVDDATETWQNCYNAKERLAYIREHRRDFEFHDWRDLLGCVRGKYFGGDISAMSR